MLKAYRFDTNQCIACQTCTAVCKTTWTSGKGQEQIFWNHVETKPYGGYPQTWDSQRLEKLGGQPCKGDVYSHKTIFDNPPAGEAVTG